jgi:hypothetical protein
MRSGVYHDEHEGTGYRTARCPLPAAKAAADRLVELGRAAKAAA